MAVTVRLPSPLRPLAGGKGQVEVQAATVGEVVAALEQAHPGFRDRLLDGRGDVQRFVNLFVGEDDVRSRRGLDTPVTDGDVVSIVPAVAGG